MTASVLDPAQLYTSCRLLDNRVGKLSGNDDITFEEFLEDYVELVTNLHIPHEHAKALLPLYLTSGAKLKYQSLSKDQKKD